MNTNHTTHSTPALVIKCQPSEYCCCIRTDDNNNTFTRTRALATNPISIDQKSIPSNILRLSK